MINEDDSGDSSQPDDEGSEDGESDDHSQEDFTLGDEQLERRQYGIIILCFTFGYSKYFFKIVERQLATREAIWLHQQCNGLYVAVTQTGRQVSV